MNIRPNTLLTTCVVVLLGGCASAPAPESAESGPREQERAPAERTAAEADAKRVSVSRDEAARERRPAESSRESRSDVATNTERASARRAVTATSSQGGPADVSRLVEQLREAARELATLRAANARLKVERDRAEKASKSAAESEESRRIREKATADLKIAAEELQKLKSAVEMLEENISIEKRLRLEAEANASQLRDQLRTLARAVSELAAEPRQDENRGRSRD
jgi:hypothetical protein